MKVQYYTKGRISNALTMANYIIEGHTTVETAKEFDCSKETIDKNIQSLGYAAFYDEYYAKKLGFDVEVLKTTYKKAVIMLKKLASKNLSESLKKYNASKARTIKPATASSSK